MDGIYEDSFENTCTKFELKLLEVRVAKVNVQLEADTLLVAHYDYFREVDLIGLKPDVLLKLLGILTR